MSLVDLLLLLHIVQFSKARFELGGPSTYWTQF